MSRLRPTAAELRAILAAHSAWLKRGRKGVGKANLRRANLSEADLRGADLSGARLTDVAGVTADQIASAKLDAVAFSTLSNAMQMELMARWALSGSL